MVVAVPSKSVNCCLVGDGMVGKTCLAQSFTGQTLDKSYVATVFNMFSGSAFVAGDKYKINISDSAGQHDYEDVRNGGYEGSEVFVVCYSVVDRESYDSITDFWIPELKKIDRKRPIVLVGTQSDLRCDKCDDYVTEKEGKRLAKDIGAECYLECSVSSKSGIKQVFETVVMTALKCKKRRYSLIKRVLAR